MNRREFLANPALPAMAVAAGGLVAVKADEDYIRVPAPGHRVRIRDTPEYARHAIGKEAVVRNVFLGSHGGDSA